MTTKKKNQKTNNKKFNPVNGCSVGAYKAALLRIAMSGYVHRKAKVELDHADHVRLAKFAATNGVTLSNAVSLLLDGANVRVKVTAPARDKRREGRLAKLFTKICAANKVVPGIELYNLIKSGSCDKYIRDWAAK